MTVFSIGIHAVAKSVDLCLEFYDYIVSSSVHLLFFLYCLFLFRFVFGLTNQVV